MEEVGAALQNSIQIWVLSGVVGLLVTIVIILFRQLLTTIQNLTKGINDLNVVNAKLTEQIKTLFGRNNDIKRDIEKLDERVDQSERDIVQIRECLKKK